MEYENKFVGLSSVTSNDLKILRYELESVADDCPYKDKFNDIKK